MSEEWGLDMDKSVNNKFFKIDNRTKEDIVKDIKALAESYVPEWIYNLDDPDAGSVIANIYSQMLEDDINKLNLLMYKYQIELMNMIGIKLKQAEPAKCVVTFSLLPMTDEGVYIPQKTKLVADGKDGNKIIFETQNSMYVTGSKITDIYTTSREKGKIINVYNQELQSTQGKSFCLFDYSQEGEQRNEFVFGHDYALNLNTKAVLSVCFSNGKNSIELMQKLSDTNKYEWNYSTANGFVKFDKVEYKDGKILLTKSDNSQKLTLSEDENHTQGDFVSVKQIDNKIFDVLEVNDVKISSCCFDVLPDIVYQDSSQVDVKEFYPFGDKLAVYNECYIASDDVFSKSGAEIVVEFDLSYFKNIIEMNYNENKDYKIIMKKPMVINYDMSEAKAENVVFEYFNGVGWAKLDLDDNYSNLFSGEVLGKTVLKFICPRDIKKIAVNAYERYWIKVRLLKADDCYRVPCSHLVPIIKNLHISYSYKDSGVRPNQVISYSGVTQRDVSDLIKQERSVVIFQPISYDKNSAFIGFDKKFCDGPINIYFDIDGTLKKDGDNIKLEYSCFDDAVGFKQLKIVDQTENFRHSGEIIFLPPHDMAKKNIFNKDRYWIRIVDDKNEFANLKCLKINDIILNTVNVENVETKDPENFYIDKPEPNMKFNLSNKNILYADVFVNEMGSLSIYQMDEMMKENPDDVIAEYDSSGNYFSFFVKWKEVDTFVKSSSFDRHYVLNRLEGVLEFGDSIKGKMPGKQLREAIKVFSVVCNGENGNVDKGAINKIDTMVSFIKGVTNPVSAYVGHDIESVNNALIRGSNIINSYNKLVSERDFERAVMDFSDIINKVKCVASVDEYGESKANVITIAVLTKEFGKNGGAFYSIKDRIKEDLLSKCELCLNKEDLNIVDPMFVALSVDVWIKVNDYNMSFEIKNNILEYLKLFIDPVVGNFHGEGWGIGKLPREVQIYSFLKSKNIGAIIEKIIVTGKMKTMNGQVEKDINQIRYNPFMMGINGDHHVFIDVD